MSALVFPSSASLLALTLFVWVSSITPGPNNLMLLTGGMSRGFWACRAHILGITFGCALMIYLSYLGMAALFKQPAVEWVLRTVGCAYLLYLSYALAKSGMMPQTQENPVPNSKLPLNFWQAALFQWINPKAWAMVLLMPGIALFGGPPLTANLPLVAMAAVINIASISVWAYGGHSLQKLWRYPRLISIIHKILVLMTLYCAVSMWL